MGDEATALNYLASRLVNPEEPPLLDAATEQWMTEQGMDENDKRNMRFQFQRHGAQLTQHAAAPPVSRLPRGAAPPDTSGRAGMGREAWGLQVTPESVGEAVEAAKAVTSTTPSIESVTARPEALTPAPPPPAPATPAVPEQSPDVTDERRGGGPIGARMVDGRIVFTNVGVGGQGDVSPEEEAQYGKAVEEWRKKADVYQQTHMREPAKGYISATGVPIPGRHFKADVNAPLPGEEGAPGVSQPYMADPFEPVEGDDWNDMSPGSRRAFLQQVGEIAAAQGQRAEGLIKAAEARAATDPTYAVEHRMALYNTFLERAKNSAEVRQTVDAASEAWLQLPANKGKSANSPEYRAFQETAEKEAMLAYLNKYHASYAPWDEILSKNVGLTI